MINLTKKTRQLLGIKHKNKTDIFRKINSGQNGHPARIKTDTLPELHYIYNKNTIKCLADAEHTVDKNVLDFRKHREEKMMKEKTGKAQKILQQKSARSFDEIF